MKASQGRFHWDKRHKRYVQLQPDEKLRGTGKRKTESGGVVRHKFRCSNSQLPSPKIQPDEKLCGIGMSKAKSTQAHAHAHAHAHGNTSLPIQHCLDLGYIFVVNPKHGVNDFGLFGTGTMELESSGLRTTVFIVPSPQVQIPILFLHTDEELHGIAK